MAAPGLFQSRRRAAVRAFVLAHPNIIMASSFHSGSDMLLYPWGWSAEASLPDAYWYTALSAKGSQLAGVNGFIASPYAPAARGREAGSGSAMDWLYERGILAWTPEVYHGVALAFRERLGNTNSYRAGWSIGNLFNPPPAEIPLTVGRWLRWNLYLLAATPHIGLDQVQVDRNQLHFHVFNDGLIPLNVQVDVTSTNGTSTATLARLSADSKQISLPLHSDHAPGQIQVTLVAAADIHQAPGPKQTRRFTFTMSGNRVKTGAETGGPAAELQSYFGGWYAAPGWQTQTAVLMHSLCRYDSAARDDWRDVLSPGRKASVQ